MGRESKREGWTGPKNNVGGGRRRKDRGKKGVRIKRGQRGGKEGERKVEERKEGGWKKGRKGKGEMEGREGRKQGERKAGRGGR